MDLVDTIRDLLTESSASEPLRRRAADDDVLRGSAPEVLQDLRAELEARGRAAEARARAAEATARETEQAADAQKRDAADRHATVKAAIAKASPDWRGRLATQVTERLKPVVDEMTRKRVPIREKLVHGAVELTVDSDWFADYERAFRSVLAQWTDQVVSKAEGQLVGLVADLERVGIVSGPRPPAGREPPPVDPSLREPELQLVDVPELREIRRREFRSELMTAKFMVAPVFTLGGAAFAVLSGGVNLLPPLGAVEGGVRTGLVVVSAVGGFFGALVSLAAILWGISRFFSVRRTAAIEHRRLRDRAVDKFRRDVEESLVRQSAEWIQRQQGRLLKWVSGRFADYEAGLVSWWGSEVTPALQRSAAVSAAPRAAAAAAKSEGNAVRALIQRVDQLRAQVGRSTTLGVAGAVTPPASEMGTRSGSAPRPSASSAFHESLARMRAKPT